MTDPILQIVLDALAEAKGDVTAGLVKLGDTRRALHVADERPGALRAVFKFSDKTLGERTIETMRSNSVPLIRDALDVAYDEGYEQACRDVFDDITAYLKGCN